MNFPENERTGVLGEIDVERIFHAWYWNAGRDRLDTGYDLFVEPDRTRYKGGRFLVQVKGTAKKSKGVVAARVSKSNLRMYAACQLPVFILRVTPDGTIYWLHAQAWAKANFKRLDGNGETSLRFEADRTLENKVTFCDYLDEALKPQVERSLIEVASDRSSYLSSIDPRLSVKASVVDGAETFEITAASEPMSLGVQMEPDPDPDNVALLQDAIRYGLPASIKVDKFEVSGSEVLSAIGANGPSSGMMSIEPAKVRKGSVSIFPGHQYSLLATELNLPANHYVGHGGFAITNADYPGVVALKLLGDRNANGSFQITLSVRHDVVESAPIKDHLDLGHLGAWAEEMLLQSGLHLELRFFGSRARVKSQPDAPGLMRPIMNYFRTVGRLHRVARKLDSDFVLTKDMDLTSQDAVDIDLLYQILRGERSKVVIGRVPITPTAPIADAEGVFRIETGLSFAIGGKKLGEVPVALDLENYTLKEEDGQRVLAPKTDANVHIYYFEGATDTVMSREPMPA